MSDWIYVGSSSSEKDHKMSKKSRPVVVNRRAGFTERAKLKYAQLWDVSSGTFSTYSFRGNGMYDPYAGAGGAQPNGFDEYMALYKHFYVIGSKIRCLCMPQSSSQGGLLSVTIRADSNSGTTPTDLVAAAGTVNSKTFFPTTNTGQVNYGVEMERSTHAILDMPRRDDALIGSSSADPTEQWDWHVHVGTLDGSTAGDYHLLIIVEYDVEFFGRKALIQS
jgi:hypothetical protein